MEYVEGDSLFDRIEKSGPLNSNVVIDYTYQILSGLVYINLLSTLLQDDDDNPVAPSTSARKEATAASSTRKKAPSLHLQSQHQSSTTPLCGERFANVPDSVLCTIIKLYLSEFAPQLEVITGYSDTEEERFIKQVKPTTDRETLFGYLSSIRGTITLQTSISTLKNTMLCGAGIYEFGPAIGLELTGVRHWTKRRMKYNSLVHVPFSRIGIGMRARQAVGRNWA